MSALKVCSTCRVALPLDKFWRNRRRPDGLQNNCRDCMRDDGPANVTQATISRLLEAVGRCPRTRHEIKRLADMEEDHFGLALATCMSLNFVGFKATAVGPVFYRK